MPRGLPQNSSSWDYIEKEREYQRKWKIEQRTKHNEKCHACGTFEKSLRRIPKEGYYLLRLCDDCASEGARKLKAMSEEERSSYLEKIWDPLRVEVEAAYEKKREVG